MGKKTEDRLWPCPFCGAEHPDMLIQEFGYMVVCRDRCGVEMRVYSRIKAQVLASWNRYQWPYRDALYKARIGLLEAITQLEYLDERHPGHATTATSLVRVREALKTTKAMLDK